MHWCGVAAALLKRPWLNVGKNNVAGMLQKQVYNIVHGYLYLCVGYSNVAGLLQSVEMYVAICM
jgi:hypothetical protein